MLFEFSFFLLYGQLKLRFEGLLEVLVVFLQLPQCNSLVREAIELLLEILDLLFQLRDLSFFFLDRLFTRSHEAVNLLIGLGEKEILLPLRLLKLSDLVFQEIRDLPDLDSLRLGVVVSTLKRMQLFLEGR